ncbi:hypothetical protein JOB18_012376 [Solea senegalensis]|uniref:Uncharacterized protein n=1 Tax=Solea senegalensis TaxID=28829 RepID=A0AAV6RDN2_SOLSE|nr:hypothetical protein JOB18_012376 [Solea senegalensis]
MDRWKMHNAPLLVCVAFSAMCCQAVSEPDDSLLSSGSSGISMGGLKSVLKDAVSPAFGATIIIIITVVMSGSAYLCFLKYVCADCCKPMQVAPTVDVEPNKVEEQV